MSIGNPAVSTSSQSSGWDRILGGAQSIGRSLMLPIAVLPAAALLLRFGQDDFVQLPWMVAIGSHVFGPWLAAAGNAVFSNLPMIFAIGIAIGLAGGEGAAALAGLVGFLVFTAVFNTVIPQVDGKPDPSISMGVLSGIMVGLITAGLYKRFHDIRLPDYLAFFGGRRFVPIITAFIMLILGIVLGYIWPPIQQGINSVGLGIVSLGPIGTGIYGFLNRLLIPVGLHHVLNSYVWFQLGTYNGATGVVHGDLNRYFAGDPTAGNFMAGFFPMMMFGLPGACLAMIRQAKYPKVAAGILLSAAFASFLTGITEPIEFAFLFVAPVLFVIHALLTGTALAICTLLNIKIGFGFSAGFIDYALNFNKSNTTNPLLLLLIGLIYGVVYYFIFSFCIKRFNLGTPGRGEESTGLSADWILPESQRGPKPGTVAAATTTTAEEDKDTVLARNVVDALGGKENIQSVEGCITRLRLFINEPDSIDEPRLKSLGASGVVKRGKVVQVVMGTQSDRIAARMGRIIKEKTTVEENA
ncbi:N-acetylglucosamine-specific PTS transporter subunit IIBC [Ktedonobacter robiniae]|uniref:PTS acetylglucosamine transporter subunit IIB n=1 Tax=Ktedonobacter robiniae TaxID=2778365 RepID=A0ABQ3UTD0_9CHLR|nr:N-acetylglucosamine-specific PTS transporter subunit IIBC [Ktedonobacter robiniae]GHO55632.1 PTS acetylglucosamine transporter subunit IIB [Ktedonobacter robiniae]